MTTKSSPTVMLLLEEISTGRKTWISVSALIDSAHNCIAEAREIAGSVGARCVDLLKWESKDIRITVEKVEDSSVLDKYRDVACEELLKKYSQETDPKEHTRYLTAKLTFTASGGSCVDPHWCGLTNDELKDVVEEEISGCGFSDWLSDFANDSAEIAIEWEERPRLPGGDNADS